MQKLRNFNQSQNNENNIQQSKLVPFAKPQSQLMFQSAIASYSQINDRTMAAWKCIHRINLPVVKIGRLSLFVEQRPNRRVTIGRSDYS
ncbi:MAG: hypothetical protein U0103_02965 [Candidatus Obscuribacterales bacterium]